MTSQILLLVYAQGHAGAAIAYGSLLLRGKLCRCYYTVPFFLSFF